MKLLCILLVSLGAQSSFADIRQFARSMHYVGGKLACYVAYWELEVGDGNGTHLPIPTELKLHLAHTDRCKWNKYHQEHRVSNDGPPHARQVHYEYVEEECALYDEDLPSKFWSVSYQAEHRAAQVAKEAALKKEREEKELAEARAELARQRAEQDRIAKEKRDEMIALLKRAHGEEVEILKGMIKTICEKTGFPYPEGL